MKTSGVMLRKMDQIYSEECRIEKLIQLPDRQYQYFKLHLMEEQNFIKENQDAMYLEHIEGSQYLSHCLLVMGEQSEDGVLIRSEGADYARYAAYQPHIRSYITEQLSMVADRILRGEFGKQENGSWLIGWDDIKEHFDITVSKTNGIGQMLVDELNSRDEVSEIIATEDCIEMSVILMQNENADMSDMVSVMGCNLTEPIEEDTLEDNTSMTHTMNKQEVFIDELNKVLIKADFDKLDKSLNGQDNAYAKEILGKMHEAFVYAYGTEPITEDNYEFLELPVIIRGRDTGHLALGTVTIDMESSGEHWGTVFVTPLGVLVQGNSLSPQEGEYLKQEFIPYDYWYTPNVEGDIHIGFEDVPEQIKELLKNCETVEQQDTEEQMDMKM